MLHISNSKSFHSFLSTTHFILHKLLPSSIPLLPNAAQPTSGWPTKYRAKQGTYCGKASGGVNDIKDPPTAWKMKHLKNAVFFKSVLHLGHLIEPNGILHQSNGWITKKRPVDHEFRQSSWCKRFSVFGLMIHQMPHKINFSDLKGDLL